MNELQITAADLLNADTMYDMAEAARLDYDYGTDLILKRWSAHLEPEIPQAHLNYSIALMRLDLYDLGWEEYKWMHLNPSEDGDDSPEARCHGLVHPEWDGVTSLKNKGILVVCEEGLGDYIQFLRYALKFKENKQDRTRLLVLVPPSLKELFLSNPLIDRVIVGGEGIRGMDYDYWTVTCVLPSLINAGVPTPLPAYLYTDPKNNARWKALLAKQHPRSDTPLIGVVWGGNPKHSNDYKRSVDIEQFNTLFDIEHITFVSLQMDARRTQNHNAQLRHNFIELGHQIQSFADTASALELCDLLISVDSAPAHVAGAIGVEAWVLVADMPDWRWGLDRIDTLWYENMTLFRKPEYGDWADALTNIRKALLERYPAPVDLGYEQ